MTRTPPSTDADTPGGPIAEPTKRRAVGEFALERGGRVDLDIAFVTYHLREHGLSVKEGGGSAAGVVLGVLGAGCAACGSAILVGLLSLVGATGLLTLLPFEGLEFTALAVGVLVLSMYWLADGMRGGEIRGCPVGVGS